MYTVSGTFRPGRHWQPFTREVEAGSERHARDKLLSELTSRHGIARAHVRIDDVSEA